MKAILRITLLVASIAIVGVTIAQAQRVIKGTVYMEGKPAAGITVEAHKGGDDMMTSFDGKYEVEADAKSKYIKFTFIDESKKFDIEGKSGDVFDFAFTGEIPTAGAKSSAASGDVNLSKLEDLMKAQDKGFMNELSLYTEFYKQKDFSSASPHWEKLYNQYPASTPNLYIHGGKMFEHQLANVKTDEERDALVDEFMKLYDRRMEHFGKRGYVMGRKGTSWYKHKLYERENSVEGDELKKIHKSGYQWLSESVKEQGNETEAPVLVLFMQSTVALFKLGELPKEQVVKNYETVMGIANTIVEANENEKTVTTINEQVIPSVEKIFEVSGAADCESLIRLFTPQYQDNIDDADFIKKMLRRLRRANCTESELIATGTERLYQLDPSAEAAFNMARRYLKKDDMEKAREYYQMAINQETDNDLLASYYYERGLLRYAKDNNLMGAREDARKALSLKSDYCEANMLIGNIYLAASKNFKGTDLEKSAVFWLACDYFDKARRGEDCAIDASEQSRKYRKYWPNKEEAFMEGMQAGSTHKVGGWINETTKVRF